MIHARVRSKVLSTARRRAIRSTEEPMSKSFRPEPARDLYWGLIRLPVGHYAAEEPILGLGMAKELERNGYHISPGTLYRLLHGLERKAISDRRRSSYGRSRTVDRITPLGRRALAAARNKVHELFA